MHIFLGNAPWYRPGHYGVRAGSRWPHFEHQGSRYMPFPFFMGYAAALLEASGHQVTVCDGAAERISADGFYQRVSDARPDLVLLEISTASLSSDLKDIAALSKRLPGVPLAVAGPHAPMFSPEWLSRHSTIDYVLVGEYEFTLQALAAALATGSHTTLDDIPGLIFRDANGTPVSTGRPELVGNLDRFPLPARHLFPMRCYHDTPGGIPEPSVQMWGSRGCPYRCAFCVWPQVMYGGSTYRARTATAMADEFERLVLTDGYQSVYFDDDTFNIGKKRILAFCDELEERGLHTTPWAIMARADLMDRELLSRLKDAGLQAVKYGLESADQGIVNRCGKDLNLGKATQAVTATQELGISVHITFCFGLPGETRATAEQTIRTALRLSPDTLQFSIATPFPGSRYYEEMAATGKLTSDDFSRYDGYTTAVVCTDTLTAGELEAIRDEATRRWDAHCLRGRIKARPAHYLIDGLRHPFSLPEKLKRLFSPL